MEVICCQQQRLLAPCGFNWQLTDDRCELGFQGLPFNSPIRGGSDSLLQHAQTSLIKDEMLAHLGLFLFPIIMQKKEGTHLYTPLPAEVKMLCCQPKLGSNPLM